MLYFYHLVHAQNDTLRGYSPILCSQIKTSGAQAKPYYLACNVLFLRFIYTFLCLVHMLE